MQAHRFIYECHFGKIADGMEIDHINAIRDDNRLCNLQVMTPKQNMLKAAKTRNYEFSKYNHANKKAIKGVNLSTNQEYYFSTIYATSRYLDINPGIISMCSQHMKNCKTGISKKDKCHYSFEFIHEKDLPADHIKSQHKKPNKFTDVERKIKQKERINKWQKQDYCCSDCKKTYKNSYRYAHKKHCSGINKGQEQ